MRNGRLGPQRAFARGPFAIALVPPELGRTDFAVPAASAGVELLGAGEVGASGDGVIEPGGTVEAVAVMARGSVPVPLPVVPPLPVVLPVEVSLPVSLPPPRSLPASLPLPLSVPLPVSLPVGAAGVPAVAQPLAAVPAGTPVVGPVVAPAVSGATLPAAPAALEPEAAAVTVTDARVSPATSVDAASVAVAPAAADPFELEPLSNVGQPVTVGVVVVVELLAGPADAPPDAGSICAATPPDDGRAGVG